MPDSFGKRQRRDVKAKKAVAREERRVARAQRREDRETGAVDPQDPELWLAPPPEPLIDEPARSDENR